MWSGLATRFRGGETVTDENGEYSFARLSGTFLSSGESDFEGFTLTGLTLKHAEYVCSDGESWHDLQVEQATHVADFTMVRGGKVQGTVVDADTGQPAAELALRIHDDVMHAGGGHSLDYATTDADGRFTSEPLFPGTYIVDINDNNYQGRFNYPKIGTVTVTAGETNTLQLTTRERPELQDPFFIEGNAHGENHERIGYHGGVRIRLGDSAWKLRSHGGGIDGPGNFGLRFGTVERQAVTDESPFGIGTLDIELSAASPGYKLVRRMPAEPLRITDNPDHPELLNGVRYLRPNQPLTLELIFARE